MVAKMSSKKRVLMEMAAKAVHTSRLRTNIPAGMAAPAPPLGTMLGQRSINIANFCRDFNERTANIKKGIPLPTRAKAITDKTFEMDIHMPPATYFIKQAAGIEKGRMKGNEVAGKITFRHLYEIAKIKIKDPPNALLSLEDMTKMLVSAARSCGVAIVRDLDPVEYGKFLQERKVIIAQQKAEIEEAREAKMLRS